MPSKGGQKDINELKRLVVANGFKLVPNGAGHWKLLDKKGRVVQDNNGPVIISGTASDFRARDMHVHRLLAAGALKSDPWKPDEGKTDAEREKGKSQRGFKREQIEKAHAVQAEQARIRAEQTTKLRGRIEPFVVAIGGWGKRGLTAELARTAFHFLKMRNRVECWETLSGAEQNARQLQKGNTLSDKSRDAWNIFMDEIERAGDTIEARRSRYFEIVREAKGLGTSISGPASTPPEPARIVPEVEDEAPAVTGDEQLAALTAYASNGYKTPTLALRALAEMMEGASAGDGLLPESSARRERAISIAEDILDMEIRMMTGRYVGVEVTR